MRMMIIVRMGSRRAGFVVDSSQTSSVNHVSWGRHVNRRLALWLLHLLSNNVLLIVRYSNLSAQAVALATFP